MWDRIKPSVYCSIFDGIHLVMLLCTDNNTALQDFSSEDRALSNYVVCDFEMAQPAVCIPHLKPPGVVLSMWMATIR